MVISVTQTGEKSAIAVVPDDKLSLAIGRDGQNARLAARLTGWKIDVKSLSAAEKMNLNTTENRDGDDEDFSDEGFGDDFADEAADSPADVEDVGDINDEAPLEGAETAESGAEEPEKE